MNRSIFKICKINLKVVILNLIFSFFILFFINFNYIIECLSLKNVKNSFLKEIHYNGSTFMCSNSISELRAKKSIDLAIQNNIKNNLSICKYFEIINGVPIPFNKYTCYAHPNLFFGVYNDLYFNLQFSHNVVDSYFKFFNERDITGLYRTQYLCNRIYIYENNLNQQFLNFNALNNNNFTPYINNKHNEIQNYINLNVNDLRKKITKGLKT